MHMQSLSHLSELDSWHNQLQFIRGYKASVRAGQKPGSGGKICKASSHPKDSSRVRLVQERAGWHTPADNMKEDLLTDAD